MEENSANVAQHLPDADQARVFGQAIQNSKFDYLLLESVDEALADLLGRRSRDQIYDHLATAFRYGREEIPVKIADFYEFLENTFSSGSATVGKTIIRRLSDRLGYEFVHVPGFGFHDYLDALRARFERDVDQRERITRASSYTYKS